MIIRNLIHRHYYTLLSIAFMLFMSSFAKSQDKTPADRMDYHLSWDGKSTILKIDLVYNTNLKDSTVFIFGNPAAGGQPRIFEMLGNANISGGDSLTIRPKDRQLIVRHYSQGLKKLHFEIDGKLITDTIRVRPNEAFRPTIAPGFLYTLGYQLFMEVNDPALKSFGIVWDSWPQGMPYLVSTNPKAKPNEMQVIQADDTKNQFMLQMSENLVIQKNVIKGIPYYLLTSKSDSSSRLPENIKPMMIGFMPQVRDFWQDYNAPFYILSAIPFQNKVSSTMTGMGLLNGLSIRYSGPLDIEKTELIAHEMSHNWIGVRLKYESTGMENNWFNEGFNDYIAVYNLARAGLFDSKTFLSYMNNDNLKAHYTSPVGTLAGDSIEPNFFKSRLYEKIPYQRGLIYAFYLDNQIRLATGGKQTIRDFLLLLYRQNQKDKGRPFTANDFTGAIAKFLPESRVSEEIKIYMLKGDYIDFSKVKLIDAFNISYKNHVPVLTLSPTADLKKIYK